MHDRNFLNHGIDFNFNYLFKRPMCFTYFDVYAKVFINM